MTMTRRKQYITQSEARRIIRAAKLAGADEVLVPIAGGRTITVKLKSAAEDEAEKPKTEEDFHL